MALQETIAWLWSGVATSTASKFFSASNIFRQSEYFLAFGLPLKDSAARFQSQSHSATTLTAPVSFKSDRLSAPRPPAPTTARLTLSGTSRILDLRSPA